ncbi:hypothetical protein GQ44DRAFT_728846 [Phaeosphaeriaceae sp. PMI808]|nr:hypothetical protein GQ44DRAFT_728846 [Phaeosphaeriaceae sp. PMI808]
MLTRSEESEKPKPVLNRNKSLPSPPIAQLIDRSCPIEAQRTLVDAEAGALSSDDWPILRPELQTPRGPVISVSPDADAIIMGTRGSGATPTSVATPVKISPIRAMRSSRQSSGDNLPTNVSSAPPTSTSRKTTSLSAQPVTTECTTTNLITGADSLESSSRPNESSPSPENSSQAKERTSQNMSSHDPALTTVSSESFDFSQQPTAYSISAVNRASLSKLSASTHSTSIQNHSIRATYKSRSIQTNTERIAYFAPPSNAHIEIKEPQHGQIGNEINEVKVERKVKAKQSLRHLLHKLRDSPPIETLPKIGLAKVSTTATTSNTLAKRISKRFSKVHLPTFSQSTPLQRDTRDTLTKHQAALDALEGSSSASTSNALTAMSFNKAILENMMLNHIDTMSADSEERGRVRKIAKALIQTIDMRDEAKTRVEKARKEVFDAEQKARSAQMTLVHGLTECEYLFDDQTADYIKAFVTHLEQDIAEAISQNHTGFLS